MNRDHERAVLIVGAGEAGRMVAAEIRGHRELHAAVAGFLDDDPVFSDRMVDGIPILGRTSELEAILASCSIDEIIIAIPTAPGRFVRDMVKHCRRAGIPFKIVPGVMEIIKGAVNIGQIREVRVEDLLGRETVDLDIESAKEVLAGKRILVTGAGGTIGSELCRQLAKVEPAELILLGRGENRIFEIEDELAAFHPRLAVRVMIHDLREWRRALQTIQRAEPDVIYHTAAHKHVHYMERDPDEAVINNVAVSSHLIRAAEHCGTGRFVFISTDKAANPTGVMGATKRIIELYLRSKHEGSTCRFMTVRFGNVIGSTGSVVPLFLKQIERGGPVTVSDPRATRYFMTVREASLLVVRASVIGTGGETFILDMGEALNILEIAHDIIVLSGHEPENEIPIVITGLREGEKLHEELINADEELVQLDGERMMLARPSDPVPGDIERGVDEMIELARKGETKKVLEAMSNLIPGCCLSDRAPV
ncbi:MAG TPA: nucleoside-diphosphate sugar epimerase/dehydratase [Patescibacteria group bacterium]|nr:nucleoside-diphosphate sugar epimerase/dehydratase [Patescibacteria group bacterium]